MIIKEPTICNICGGKVEYIINDKIYGKPYGSGYCYHCKDCGAYVGTHIPRPKEALGLLADKEMRNWKMYCHTQFDKIWKSKQMSRKDAYYKLSKEMHIPFKECHFGYFNIKQLKQAYAIIKNKF